MINTRKDKHRFDFSEKFLFVFLVIKFKALHMLSRCSIIELHPSPDFSFTALPISGSWRKSEDRQVRNRTVSAT